jgi:hypothetical protein
LNKLCYIEQLFIMTMNENKATEASKEQVESKLIMF